MSPFPTLDFGLHNLRKRNVIVELEKHMKLIPLKKHFIEVWLICKKLYMVNVYKLMSLEISYVSVKPQSMA